MVYPYPISCRVYIKDALSKRTLLSPSFLSILKIRTIDTNHRFLLIILLCKPWGSGGQHQIWHHRVCHQRIGLRRTEEDNVRLPGPLSTSWSPCSWITHFLISSTTCMGSPSWAGGGATCWWPPLPSQASRYTLNLTERYGKILMRSTWSDAKIGSSVVATAPVGVYEVNKLRLSCQIKSSRANPSEGFRPTVSSIYILVVCTPKSCQTTTNSWECPKIWTGVNSQQITHLDSWVTQWWL